MLPERTVVRMLSPADAEELWHLRLLALESEPAAFTATAEEHRRTTSGHLAQRLEPSASGNAVFGAFDGARLIGMTGLYRRPDPDAHVARIWGMFVIGEFRGRGLGRDLVRRVLSYARELPGITTVDLHVASTQQAARRLYVSCGFRPTGAFEHGNEHMCLLIPRAGVT